MLALGQSNPLIVGAPAAFAHTCALGVGKQGPCCACSPFLPPCCQSCLLLPLRLLITKTASLCSRPVWNSPCLSVCILHLAFTQSGCDHQVWVWIVRLQVVDVGGGTGFCTLGVVKSVKPENVTLIDQ